MITLPTLMLRSSYASRPCSFCFMKHYSESSNTDHQWFIPNSSHVHLLKACESKRQRCVVAEPVVTKWAVTLFPRIVTPSLTKLTAQKMSSSPGPSSPVQPIICHTELRESQCWHSYCSSIIILCGPIYHAIIATVLYRVYRMLLIWMGLDEAFTHVCGDSSRTVLEYHRSLSHMHLATFSRKKIG